MPRYEMKIMETRTGSLIIDTDTLEEAFELTREDYEDGNVFWHNTEESFSLDQELED
tara:strand:+ start:853 stop:1023 length:171 start_codon:yes stop_codon:yes gene_type:complete